MTGQVATRPVTIHRIMRDPNFARGLDEVRSARSFDWRVDDWQYERGRLFGCIAPLGMPLFVATGKLNPKAMALYIAADQRGFII